MDDPYVYMCNHVEIDVHELDPRKQMHMCPKPSTHEAHIMGNDDPMWRQIRRYCDEHYDHHMLVWLREGY